MANVTQEKIMAELTREQVEEAIKGYVEPHLETDLVAAK